MVVRNCKALIAMQIHRKGSGPLGTYSLWVFWFSFLIDTFPTFLIACIQKYSIDIRNKMKLVWQLLEQFWENPTIFRPK